MSRRNTYHPMTYRWALSPVPEMSGPGLSLMSEHPISDWRARSPTLCRLSDLTFYRYPISDIRIFSCPCRCPRVCLLSCQCKMSLNLYLTLNKFEKKNLITDCPILGHSKIGKDWKISISYLSRYRNKSILVRQNFRFLGLTCWMSDIGYCRHNYQCRCLIVPLTDKKLMLCECTRSKP